jgi:hypothetical protein
MKRTILALILALGVVPPAFGAADMNPYKVLIWNNGVLDQVGEYQTLQACRIEAHALHVRRTPPTCTYEACMFPVYCVNLFEQEVR